AVGKVEVGGQYADNCPGYIAEPDGRANHASIAMKELLPYAIGQNGNIGTPFPPFLRDKGTTYEAGDLKDVKEIGNGRDSADQPRVIVAESESNRDVTLPRQSAESRGALAPDVHVLRIGSSAIVL